METVVKIMLTGFSSGTFLVVREEACGKKKNYVRFRVQL
jgi:hypothetical protein